MTKLPIHSVGIQLGSVSTKPLYFAKIHWSELVDFPSTWDFVWKQINDLRLVNVPTNFHVTFGFHYVIQEGVSAQHLLGNKYSFLLPLQTDGGVWLEGGYEHSYARFHKDLESKGLI